MAGIGRTPLPTFVGGFIGIILYLIAQFTNPFLSDLAQKRGVLVKYEIISDKWKYENDYLALWLDSEKEPFINQYPMSYKKKMKDIDNLMYKEVTLWYDDNREIFQLASEGIKVIDYDWFAPMFLIILAMGLFFHIGSYLDAKNGARNINTYAEMWEYALGYRVPIMKHTNKPYNPDDVIDLSWFDNFFRKKKNKK